MNREIRERDGETWGRAIHTHVPGLGSWPTSRAASAAFGAKFFVDGEDFIAGDQVSGDHFAVAARDLGEKSRIVDMIEGGEVTREPSTFLGGEIVGGFF